jgi:predicted amidohydrolase YtcJ
VLIGPEGCVTAIAAPGRLRPPASAVVVDGRGGALLPGFADRHIHLMATAAAELSVPCGDPATFADRLRARAAATAPGEWVRGVGYLGDDLDRHRLDAVVADRPVRVQHRGGALWVVNGAGARALGLDDPGAELPAGADPRTGRLWRVDAWLRDRLGPGAAPDVAAVGRRLAAYGVTSVTDAGPDLAPDTVRALTAAGLPQRL